ncbi:MAG: ABC transporter ATP-binding protein [Methanobacteriota archaeon]|jgi:ABC-2 type transport system ATP-binding protein|uniref:ABC transporter ATP-binding protein n=1 Tax=Marine Group III euryarchaeote TaxID=2173149 RepID=A0A7J4GV91_9ARCH|nr:MAG: ABC transporter ATP-binding protein [Euryarchaeota archaeon]HIF36942.1 ABC transporter ATP-binding protein [Marine Group III euryarchaeote]
MAVISCNKLSKKYEDVLALDKVNLEIEKGEFFGLLGPNGAGKTTLLKILTGQIKSSEGTAEILGMNIEDNVIDVKKKIAIVPEQESPPSFLTPREVLEMVASIRQIENPDIEEWITFFELEAMEGRVCRNLSRGQKQKVMLAAAFISDTDLMFLDEPFINLDPIVQTKVRDWLIQYVDKGGTVFLNTHLLENAQRLCDRAAIIHNGEIQSMIKVKELDDQNMNLEELFHEIIQ